MDTFSTLKQLISALLFIIPTLVIIGICSYYLLQVGPKIDGILILISHIIFFLCMVTNQLFFSGLFDIGGSYFEVVNIFTTVFSFIGSILLVVGLFILMNKIITLQKK